MVFLLWVIGSVPQWLPFNLFLGGGGGGFPTKKRLNPKRLTLFGKETEGLSWKPGVAVRAIFYFWPYECLLRVL